ATEDDDALRLEPGELQLRRTGYVVLAHQEHRRVGAARLRGAGQRVGGLLTGGDVDDLDALVVLRGDARGRGVAVGTGVAGDLGRGHRGRGVLDRERRAGPGLGVLRVGRVTERLEEPHLEAVGPVGHRLAVDLAGPGDRLEAAGGAGAGRLVVHPDRAERVAQIGRAA